VTPVLKDRSTTVDLTRPRSVAEVLWTALSLYGRYPLLFVLLSFIVVVPCDLAVLAITGFSPLGQQHTSVGTLLTVEIIDFVLVGSFVSALQVQALLRIGSGERPRLQTVVTAGVKVLPVVAAAEIIAGIGIGIGLFLLVVPGVILALRWAVVAQVAAVERTDWPTALRRGAELTRRNYLRIFAVTVCLSLVTLTLTNLASAAAGTKTHPLEVVLGIALDTLTQSFRALAFAVLYFDLRARSVSV
jgi:hypothetical protein